MTNKNQPHDKTLFIDIETVPLVYSYAGLDPATRELWDRKWQYDRSIDPAAQYAKAGIYAEFAKVACICAGYYHSNGFRLHSFHSHNEKEMLEHFSDFLTKFHAGSETTLCAHNGKEFDYPFLCRRLIINGIMLPRPLRIQGLKPWNIPHHDTMELWKFGDYKNYSSLSLLAHVLGIPSPKDDIDGSMVGKVFHEDNDLERIVAYCRKDVITLARVFNRFNGAAGPKDEEIIFA